MIYSDLLAKVHEVLEERLKVASGNESGGATAPTGSAEAESTSSAGTSTSAAGAAPVTDEHKAFGASIQHWPIFSDTSAALHRLSHHFKLVVLSNVDRTSFRHTHLGLSEGRQDEAVGGIPQSKLSLYTYPDPNPHRFWHPKETEGSRSPFTLIVTAQDVACYKPALGGFQAILQYAADHPDLFGNIAPTAEGVKEKTLSVAQSLPHDHIPAARLGMRSVWIDRQSAVTLNDDDGSYKYLWKFNTLGEFADAVEKESAEVNATRKD